MKKKHFILCALLSLSILFTVFNAALAQNAAKSANPQATANPFASQATANPFTSQATANSATSQGSTTAVTPETQQTIEDLSAQFRNLSDADKLKAFNQLSDQEKLEIFQRLSQEDKNMLFQRLTPDQRKLLFPSMSQQEQEKWVQIYPDLGQIQPVPVTPATPAPGTPARPAPGKLHQSEIEKIMSGKFPSKISRKLQQFGYDFFSGQAPTFTPVGNVPVGPDYVIGPGDNFVIHVWGRAAMTNVVRVSRDGQIDLPQIGLVTVSGLTFSELKDFLYHKLLEFYPHIKMGITMGALRTIQVFVVGEARRPGSYSVSSLSTVITALYAAGGPTKNGSLRDIRVFRNGKLIDQLDLYAFLAKGIKTGDIRLQPGDTIFIPVIGPVVGIAGDVRRPAIYELKGTETIGDLIDLAGGVLATGGLHNVVVERIENHQRRVVRTFNLSPTNALADKNLKAPLMDGDIVKIYPINSMVHQVVYLEGNVKYPREYELKPGMRLRDLIPSYNVLLPEPYLPEAEITRLMPPDLHPEIIDFNLGALLAGDKTQNLLLHDQDHVKIFGRWEKEDIPFVTISGAVRLPGIYRLYDGMTAMDLIFQAGNFTGRAYKKKADLTRILTVKNGTKTEKLSFSPEKAMEGIKKDNPVLRRNDFIQIREIPQYQAALDRKVVLQGEFVFPGTYAFSEGERLSSVIKRAGGLTKEAYPFGSRFFRESVRRMQQLQLQQYIAKLQQDILEMTNLAAQKSLTANEAKIYQTTMESKQKLLNTLKQSKATGRMVVNLEEALLKPSSSNDIVLRPGDRLVVGRRPATVNVLGEVYQPTALLVEKGKTVSYYLNMVGGPNQNADTKHMYLVKADGSVVSKAQQGFFGMASWDSKRHRWTIGGGFDSQKVDPGDTIFVPMKIQTYPWLAFAKDVTQIVANVAITSGILISAMRR